MPHRRPFLDKASIRRERDPPEGSQGFQPREPARSGTLMNDHFRLLPGQFLMPTPAGAYYAASRPKPDSACRFLFGLMTGDSAPPLEPATAQRASGLGADDALELLYQIQRLGLVQAVKQPYRPPQGALGEVLGDLINQFSSATKALLADPEGFYVASCGFPHETAEEISALSADMAALQERHTRLLQGNLRLSTSNWALVDASGNSQLGFWPLYIGGIRFVMAISGVPRFNQPGFTDLVWALTKRYYQPTV